MKNIIIAAIIAPVALASGMTAAAIHALSTPPVQPIAAECGIPGEDARMCVREGAQVVSWIQVGSRDEFPRERCGGGCGPVRCT